MLPSGAEAAGREPVHQLELSLGLVLELYLLIGLDPVVDEVNSLPAPEIPGLGAAVGAPEVNPHNFTLARLVGYGHLPDFSLLLHFLQPALFLHLALPLQQLNALLSPCFGLHFLIFLVLLLDHITDYRTFVLVDFLLFLLLLVYTWTTTIVIPSDVIAVLDLQITISSGRSLMVPQCVVKPVDIQGHDRAFAYKLAHYFYLLYYILSADDDGRGLLLAFDGVALGVVLECACENKALVLCYNVGYYLADYLGAIEQSDETLMGCLSRDDEHDGLPRQVVILEQVTQFLVLDLSLHMPSVHVIESRTKHSFEHKLRHYITTYVHSSQPSPLNNPTTNPLVKLYTPASSDRFCFSLRYRIYFCSSSWLRRVSGGGMPNCPLSCWCYQSQSGIAWFWGSCYGSCIPNFLLMAACRLKLSFLSAATAVAKSSSLVVSMYLSTSSQCCWDSSAYILVLTANIRLNMVMALLYKYKIMDSERNQGHEGQGGTEHGLQLQEREREGQEQEQGANEGGQPEGQKQQQEIDQQGGEHVEVLQGDVDEKMEEEEALDGQEEAQGQGSGEGEGEEERGAEGEAEEQQQGQQLEEQEGKQAQQPQPHNQQPQPTQQPQISPAPAQPAPPQQQKMVDQAHPNPTPVSTAPIQQLPVPVQPPEPLPQLLISQSHRQQYLNNLENSLRQKQRQIKALTTRLDLQVNKNNSLEEERVRIKGLLQESEGRLAEIITHNQRLNTVNQQYQSRIQSLQQQLSAYREVGDIRTLQQQVQQLQSLVDLQKKQLVLLQQDAPPDSSTYNTRQYLQQLQALEHEQQQQQVRISQLQHMLAKAREENAESTEIMNKMDSSLKEKMSRVEQLEAEREGEAARWAAERAALQAMVAQLEGCVRGAGEGFEQRNRREREQEDSSKLAQDEKNILFREYLKLQIERNNLEQQIRQVRNSYQKVAKQLRTVKKQMVSRKDYDEIALKYKKCRICLQKAIRQNKSLRSHTQSNMEGQQQRAEPRPGNLLNQQDSNMRMYMQVFNTHVQKSIDYFKQSNDIMEDIRVEKLKQEAKFKQATIEEHQLNICKLERLNSIFEQELVYKNSLLQRIAHDLRNTTHEYNQLRREKMDMQQALTHNLTAKSSLERLESRASNLLVRNRKILAEKDNWKALYEQLKAKYEVYLANHAEIQQQDNARNGMGESDAKKGQHCMQEGEIQQNAMQAEDKKVSRSYSSAQTQTQSLGNLYFKQIKQTLNALKDAPKQVHASVSFVEEIAKQLQQQKKRYDDLQGKYNVRFKILQNEKNENDSWRQEAKKQLIADFQDIRVLIENDRLIECLRKAKNLIEGLESSKQEGAEQLEGAEDEEGEVAE